MAIIALICIVLMTGTVWAIMIDLPARKQAIQNIPLSTQQPGIFDGIGRIRARTSDGAIAILYPVFPYDDKDRQFREELAMRRVEFRALVKQVLSDRSAAELHPVHENSLKAHLRDSLNSLLVFGSIDAMYFIEFEVIP